jgi:hypothetical protein
VAAIRDGVSARLSTGKTGRFQQAPDEDAGNSPGGAA